MSENALVKSVSADSASCIGSGPLPSEDFGDRFGPMLVKEFRQGLRAKMFVGPFLLIQILAVLAVLGEALAAGIDSGGNFGFAGGMLTWVVGLMLGVVMPLTGFSALQPELQGGRNIELLLLANLSRWQIVLGKWLVMNSLAILVLISLLPYLLSRYFIGGVNLVENLSFLITIGTVNVVMNAAVIGASGFSNIIARFVVLGITMGSCSICSMISVLPLARSSSVAFDENSMSAVAQLFFLSVAVDVLFCAFGLQVGRAKIRLFENPIDPPASGLLIAMMLFTPLVLGVFTVAGILAVPIVCLLLTGAVLAIDRGPGKGKKSAPAYAQP